MRSRGRQVPGGRGVILGDGTRVGDDGREPRRLVFAKSSPMDLDGTRGRTLFPTPAQAPWPPFEFLTEVGSREAAAPSPHPHVHEEVVNYVLDGAIRHRDGADAAPSDLLQGGVNLVSATTEVVHDISPVPEIPSRWLGLGVLLEEQAGVPRFQTGYARLRPAPHEDVECLEVLGESGPIRCASGLRMDDVTVRREATWSADFGPGSTIVLYALDGGVRGAGRHLVAGEALLARHLPHVDLQGDPAGRALVLSVPGKSDWSGRP